MSFELGPGLLTRGVPVECRGYGNGECWVVHGEKKMVDWIEND